MFHSQSVGEINTELKNNTILLSFKKELFGAKKTASTFWREKWLFLFSGFKAKAFAVLPIFWGNLKGQNRWPVQIYSQKDESFLRPLRNTFTRCLTLIPSDKFWRNFLHFDTKVLWGTKTIDFQESSKIRVSCFFRQIKLPKKEFWIQANISESNFTFLANTVWNQTKVFLGALARQNFVAPTRPNWFSVKVKAGGICTTADIFKFKTNFCTSIMCFFYKAKNRTHLFSKRWKFLTTVTKHFYTLSYSNSVRQVLTKFLAFWHKSTLGNQNNRFPRVVQNSRELLLSTD